MTTVLYWFLFVLCLFGATCLVRAIVTWLVTTSAAAGFEDPPDIDGDE